MSVIVRNPGEDPFRISSDPRLAHFDAPRRRATARLLSGLYQGEGLFLLTGEDGIGKTTLLRHLGEELATLDGVRLLHTAAFIDCEVLSTFADIIAACGDLFRAGAADPLVVARVLQDLSDGEQMPSLLIDNADGLDDATLRALAMLTTLRSGERRLLSAVLAGGAELAGRMSALLGTSDQLPASHVVALVPMGRTDVERMIRHRLRLAGRPESDRIADVVVQSNGVPLQVLGLCRRALGREEPPGAAVHRPLPADLALPDLPVPDLPVSPAPASLREEPVASPDDGDAAREEHAATMPTAPSAAVGADGTAAGTGEPGTPVASPSPLPEAAPPPSFTAAGPAGDRGAGLSDFAAAGAQPGRELPGHIRYGVASAMRIEGSQWQDGRRRRPRRRALLVAAGAALLVLGTGWSLYDHTPKRLAEGGPSTVTMTPVSPKVDAPYGAALEPSHTMPTPAPAPEGSVSASIQPAPVPAQAEPVAAQAEPWWRSTGADRLRTDLPAAAGDAVTPGTTAPALAHPAPMEGSAARPLPPEPVVRPADPPKASPTVKPRPAAVATAASPDVDSAPAHAEPAPAVKPAVVPKAPPPAAKARALSTVATAPSSDFDDETVTSAVEPKAPARTRDALLAAGDEQMAMGDVAAARLAYQEAFSKGSGEAARRMAETFDPRNVAAHSKEASAAEAILWYKDAARKGDRRSRGELHGLEVWLEDAAASGDGEARRVLQAWRTPGEAEADGQAE